MRGGSWPFIRGEGTSEPKAGVSIGVVVVRHGLATEDLCVDQGPVLIRSVEVQGRRLVMILPVPQPPAVACGDLQGGGHACLSLVPTLRRFWCTDPPTMEGVGDGRIIPSGVFECGQCEVPAECDRDGDRVACCLIKGVEDLLVA